jgi:PAS domain S-box-containing protein
VPTRADAVKLASLYAALGTVLMLSSDWVVRYFVPADPMEDFVESLKGWGFVMLSGVILGLGLDRVFRTMRESTRRLQDSEGSLRSLFDTIPESVFLMDLTGTILAANETFAIRLGCSPEACVGRSVYSFVAPEVAERRRKWVEEAIRIGRPVVYEDARLGRVTRHNVCPIADEEGRIHRVVVVAVDITDQQNAEQELRASKAKLDAALSSMTDGVLISDAAGRFIHINEAFATFHKFRSKEECSVTLEEYPKFLEVLLPHGEPAPLSQWAVARALRGEVATNAEYDLRRKDTAEAWSGSYSFAPIRDKSGAIAGSVVVARDISERKQIEAALRESEMRMSLAIEAANMGLWDWDLLSGRLVWTEVIQLLWGYAPGEFPGTQEAFESRVHPEDLPDLKRVSEHAQKDRGPFQFEFRVVWPDGSLRWVSSRGRYLFDAQGKPTRLVGVIFDITERKQAELSRRRSELQQRAILDNIPDPAWMKDVEGRFLAVNQAWCRFTGLAPGEAIGRKDADIFPPHVAQGLAAQEREVIQSSRSLRWEESLRDQAGRMCTFETIKAPVVDPSGHAAGTVGIARDITERKQAEHRVRQLSLAVEQSPVSIVITDKQGLIEYVNPKFTDVTGYSLAEAQGQNPRILKASNMPPEHYRSLWETISQGRVWRGELHNRTKTGEPFWELASISPITDPSGAITHYVAVKEDITESKRLEAFRQALLGLGTRLNLARDPVHAARALLSTADELWAWDAASVDVFDPATKVVQTILSADVIEGKRCELAPMSLGTMTPRIQRVMREGALLLHQDPAQPQDGQAIRFGDVSRASASIMAVPFRREERLIGVLSIHSYAPHAYTAGDLETLQALADYCGGALERLRSEEELGRSMERYRSLVETSFDWVWEVDVEGRYTFVSPRVQELLGYAPEEVLGRTPFDLMPVPEAHRVGKIFAGIAAQRIPFSGLENFNQHKDGTLVVLESSGTPIIDAAGQYAGYRGVDRNITGRKHAEAALVASEERFRTLVENAPIGIFLQAGGRFVYLNQEAVRMFGGGPRVRLVGRPVLERFHSSTPGLVCERIRLLNEERKPAGLQEEQCLRMDGTEFLGEFLGVPFNCDGQPGVLVFFQDVTQRKSLEAQLRQAQKLEGIGQLAGGVAHDFNNILAAIMMHLGLLQLNPRIDRETAQSLKELDAEARRAATLTRQLLMFSRRSVLSVSPLDMNEIIANLLKMLGRLIGEHVRLRFDGQNGLPVVQADAGMMEQVLMNLVVNARDAMPNGGRITISTSTATFDEAAARLHQDRKPGSFVCVEVSDTGCGMEEKVLKRVFEPFFTTKEAGKGTGLGLATTHGIVAQHHGWVEVSSEVGKGSSFRIYLPVFSTSIVENRPELPPEPTRGGQESILLVEDDPTVRLLVGHALRALGYQVREAANGKEAMALWQEIGSTIDLLFTDMVMPEGISGLELVERLQAMKPGLKALISSGYSSEIVNAGRPTKAGIRYLPKPYETPALAAAVRACLESHEGSARK